MGSSLSFACPGRYFEESSRFKRVRPEDTLWPAREKWEQLSKAVNGNLIKLESPLAACKTALSKNGCEELFRNLKNPYFISDDPALTQTSGWLDAWRSEPSVYAVAAKSTAGLFYVRHGVGSEGWSEDGFTRET